ncbi:MAG TPA: acyltransferase [Cytophagaceae bacterium]|jgi:acetyltransferase-like isoleucine patch superfamily enzyme
MMDLLTKFEHRYTNWKLRRKGIEVEGPIFIHGDVEINLKSDFFDTHPGRCVIQEYCKLSRGVSLYCYGGIVKLEKNVILGPYVVMYGHGGIEIGEKTMIAMHTVIVSSNHTIPAHGKDIFGEPDIKMPVKIGRGVWIGANCTILGGVSIGDGVVIGAGAVVTKDLPPYSIAIGNPARVIRMRST